YLPHDGDNRAERAAANFFRKGNLLALRELALRRTADRVDDEMRAYRQGSANQPVWPNREALLAAVGPGTHGEKVVRSTARTATQLDVPWHAVHVETPGRPLGEAAQRTLQLAESLGATTATLSASDTATALVRYAREHNLVRLVGAPRAPLALVAQRGRPHRRTGRRPRSGAGGAIGHRRNAASRGACRTD
ncbi:MAG: two-component system sensor histidine kinase KdbD, partial [Hydrogenophaga sp.]|nr:two-component system sensor histidine kinase KdbD [Hydrogenophaga sp.]